MKCYLFLTFAFGGSYPRPKGRKLATAYLSIIMILFLAEIGKFLGEVFIADYTVWVLVQRKIQ